MTEELIKKILETAVDVAERHGLMDKLKDVFRKKHKVLVLGSTGTGKSQFLASGRNVFAPALSEAARTEWSNKVRLDINEFLVDFIDTPGQLLHRPRRVEAIREAFQNEVSGIVNVVSYGFHEYGAAPEEVLEQGSKPPRVSESYLQSHREREIALMGEWLPLVRDEWVLTLVTKADIWWDQKRTVTDYYGQGPYAEAFKKMCSHQTSGLKPFCSVVSNFYSCIPCSGSFGDHERRDLRDAAFKAVLEGIISKQ